MYNCETLNRHALPPCDGEEKYNKIVTAIIILPNATITNYADNSQWIAGIADGSIRVIKKTQGLYDGGTPTFAPGFGNKLEQVTGVKHSANFMTKYRSQNYGFFNQLKELDIKSFGFVTGDNDSLQIVEKNVTLHSKAPVTDDLAAERKWEVTATWSDINMPVPYNTPLAILAVIPAPVALEESAVSATGFTANWQLVVGAIGYIVQVSTTSNFAVILQEHETATVLLRLITGLTTGTTYYYRVVAFSFNEESGLSNTIVAITS